MPVNEATSRPRSSSESSGVPLSAMKTAFLYEQGRSQFDQGREFGYCSGGDDGVFGAMGASMILSALCRRADRWAQTHVGQYGVDAACLLLDRVKKHAFPIGGYADCRAWKATACTNVQKLACRCCVNLPQR